MAPRSSRPRYKLFQLLKFLGVDQNTLAARLGVSHTLVSLWAHGKKPIPTRHQQAITAFVTTASQAFFTRLREQVEQARQHYQAVNTPDWPRSQAADQAWNALEATLAAQRQAMDAYRIRLEEWAIEQYEHSGELTQELYRYCRVLGVYGNRQPANPSPEERQQMKEAAKEVQALLAMLDRVDPQPAAVLATLKTQLSDQTLLQQEGA
jgi:DNA-binding transcriptional regulator YdaS (Cro superfamily)